MIAAYAASGRARATFLLNPGHVTALGLRRWRPSPSAREWTAVGPRMHATGRIGLCARINHNRGGRGVWPSGSRPAADRRTKRRRLARRMCQAPASAPVILGRNPTKRRTLSTKQHRPRLAVPMSQGDVSLLNQSKTCPGSRLLDPNTTPQVQQTQRHLCLKERSMEVLHKGIHQKNLKP